MTVELIAIQTGLGIVFEGLANTYLIIQAPGASLRVTHIRQTRYGAIDIQTTIYGPGEHGSTRKF